MLPCSQLPMCCPSTICIIYYIRLVVSEIVHFCDYWTFCMSLSNREEQMWSRFYSNSLGDQVGVARVEFIVTVLDGRQIDDSVCFRSLCIRLRTVCWKSNTLSNLDSEKPLVLFVDPQSLTREGANAVTRMQISGRGMRLWVSVTKSILLYSHRGEPEYRWQTVISLTGRTSPCHTWDSDVSCDSPQFRKSPLPLGLTLYNRSGAKTPVPGSIYWIVKCFKKV